MSLRASFHSSSSSSEASGSGSGHTASRSNSTRAPKSSSKEDFTFKLVMVGDSGVGKSCLLEKFLNLSSNNAFISTIGYEVRTHNIKLDGQSVKLQVKIKKDGSKSIMYWRIAVVLHHIDLLMNELSFCKVIFTYFVMRGKGERVCMLGRKGGGRIQFKLVTDGDSGAGKSCLQEKILYLSSNNAFIGIIRHKIRTHNIKLDGPSNCR